MMPCQIRNQSIYKKSSTVPLNFISNAGSIKSAAIICTLIFLFVIFNYIYGVIYL